jgi:hypothetical protein
MATATGERALVAALRLLLPAAALLVCLGGSSQVRAGEVSLETQVDRTELALDEELTFAVHLTAPEAPSKYDVPETRDFRVVSSAPSQEHSVSLGGGAGVQIRQVYTVTQRLRPTRTGKLTLPPVTAVVRGRSYVTQPIAITVSAAGTGLAPASPPAAQGAPAAPGPGSQAGGRPYRGWERDLALQVELDRHEAFVGEQVTAEFWLLSPLELRGYENATSPRFDGFWKEELETARRLDFEVRTVNGVPTRAYLIQRLALFPTRTGELSVDPMELHGVAVALGQRNLLAPLADVVRVDRKSAPAAVHVKPLPPGAPPGFEPGNVGDLSLAAAASPQRVAVGEPITVRLAVSGDGNVRALSPPHLAAIPGTRAFEPTTRDAAGARGRRFSGTRAVETVLVPERSGELVIPAADWPFFNPRTSRYEVALSPEILVEVLPAGPAAGARTGAGTNPLTAGLRPIRAQAGLFRRGPPAWERGGFLAFLLLPPIGFAVVVLLGRLRARGERAGGLLGAGRTARRRLRGARRRLLRGDPPGGVAEVERALLGYAADRLGRPAVGLTRGALLAELSRAGAHAPAVRALVQALDAVEVARYAAGDPGGEELLSAAERAVRLLEEADWQPGEEARP